jgi:dihydropteroate synthase
MGILNVTPDSFSDGGRFVDVDRAVDHGRQLARQGAAIVDVGGESTRPGAHPVAADEEAARVVPVVAALAAHVRVSVDTAKAEVAAAAVAAGATLINDVSASLHEVAADHQVGWVAMHMQGEPRTMQHEPVYDDVVAEVEAYLRERAERAHRAGVREVWIDPGIGFGKTAAHNWQLLAALDRLAAVGLPVAVGTSRKAFLGAAMARADQSTTRRPLDDRLEGSVATAVRAAASGVAMVRVHDVAATVAALDAAGSAVRPSPWTATSRGRAAGGCEGQVGAGHRAAQLPWVMKDKLRGVRAPGRLRRQPPPGAPPGRDHLGARAGLRPPVISIIPSPANLHNYDELGVHLAAPAVRQPRRHGRRYLAGVLPGAQGPARRPKTPRCSSTARSWATACRASSPATWCGPASCRRPQGHLADRATAAPPARPAGA